MQAFGGRGRGGGEWGGGGGKEAWLDHLHFLELRNAVAAAKLLGGGGGEGGGQEVGRSRK